MKYLFFIISFICWSCNAQELPILSKTSLANSDDAMEHPKNGNYAKDLANYRDQYVGVWEYNQNGVIFQLKIEKLDQAINKIEYNGEVSNYNYTDVLTLKYKLVKNGVVLNDNLNTNLFDQMNGWGIKQVNRELYGRILDYTRNVMGSYTINKQFGSSNTIIFNLILGNYTIQNPSSYYQDGQPLFSIPTGGIEMTKIN
ncbi:DUF6705 family protein [Flavobacterium sp. AG291]|uniref:DUF6705 family protein n=1 Tax=Flavobacterium sp. AG291 TaxID=2184000 RepID=UPI000E0B4875|nr:DUF6705 family protein [Flavobacterium sp. AG291]RDI11977.1 hypothetical protein DEU42_105139 [Flavobacterium sp. AG291]